MLYFFRSLSLQLPCPVNSSKHQCASYSNFSPSDPDWKRDVLTKAKQGLDSAKQQIPWILRDPYSPYKYLIVEIETNIKPVMGVLHLSEDLKSDNEMKFLEELLINTLNEFLIEMNKDFTVTRVKISFTY